MEVIEVIAAGITLVAGLAGANKVIDFKVEQAQKEVTKLGADMERKVDCTACELHRKQQKETCTMIHSHMNETLSGIDKKFDHISGQIDSLREDRKTEMAEITNLLRETLNKTPRKT